MIARPLAALLLLSATALAAPLDVQLKNQVPPGQKPSLQVTANTALKQVRLELTRQDDGKTFTATHGALHDKQSATLIIGDGKAGRFHWKGKLIAVMPDGNQITNEVTFETASGGGGNLQAKYSRDHLDLDAHVLEFQLSKPAREAELHVFSDDGDEIGRGAATYKNDPPGTWLRIPWNQPREGNVLRLELRATAQDGSAVLVRLLPWSVRIAHEEINFPTGSADIPESEVGKLDASYAKIIEAVDKARKAQPDVNVRLFIAGHTDTVGGSADNRKLSLDRARAIAAWYRDRGLPLPVAYAGFGEDALKMKTADNVDQAVNRRADYIVGIEEPIVARGVRADWHLLK